MPVEKRSASRSTKPQRVVELPDLNLAQRITVLMAERMRVAGFEQVRATVPGFTAPAVIRGAHADHRPSVFTRFKNNRPLLLDAYDPATKDDLAASRWQLFHTAAEQAGGQFHVALPDLVEGTTGTAYAKKKAKAFGVDIHKIWEV